MKRIVCLLLLLIPIVLFAQTAESDEAFIKLLKHGYTEGIGGHDFEYKDDEFIYYLEYDEYEELYRSSLTVEHENGLTFINLPDVNKRLLCLANDKVFIMYDECSDKPYFMGFWSFNGKQLICRFNPESFTASSELKEGNTTYSAGNLASFNQKTPWVEGAPGNGIGESVSFRLSYQYLFLFSGYISYEKPWLYEQNARPKKIKVTVTEKGKSQEFIFDLEDTPHPQTLEFPDDIRGTAKLEILDVYPGTKWQDTCIHAILGKVF